MYWYIVAVKTCRTQLSLCSHTQHTNDANVADTVLNSYHFRFLIFKGTLEIIKRYYASPVRTFSCDQPSSLEQWSFKKRACPLSPQCKYLSFIWNPMYQGSFSAAQPVSHMLIRMQSSQHALRHIQFKRFMSDFFALSQENITRIGCMWEHFVHCREHAMPIPSIHTVVSDISGWS